MAASMIKVVVIHNHYQHPGGEDEVFRSETALLESRGHAVVRYTADNRSLPGRNPISMAVGAVWSTSAYRRLRELFRRERPSIAHFHNTHPLVSPAAYYAARAEGISVVQSLHNFRLVCPNGLLFRDGKVCEDCLGKIVPWPGVVHACYRGSRAATGVTAGMLGLHRAIGTWSRMVDTYVALSEFSRLRFIAGGLPHDRIVVKPNFLPVDPSPGAHAGAFGLFVGRIAPEKGLTVLQRASSQLGSRFRLKIIGGPLPEHRAPEHIEWLGAQPKERVYAEMRDAAFLVFPSECYENCPMTIIEAFATGLPVIASGRGSAAEMVEDYQTGRHFAAGDAGDLASKVDWALTNPDRVAAMGQRARLAFEGAYTAARGYDRLIEVYRRAMAG